MTSQRALVLGGGGVVGVAWEAGLCAGLFERGIDLRESVAFVGTSAGAINGARLASGRWPAAPGEKIAGTEGAVVDPTKLDPKALRAVFSRWSSMQQVTPAALREIGQLARGLYRAEEPSWVDAITRYVQLDAWPDKPLFISAVANDSGERVVFDASSGISIGRAIAASAAVPALFASVSFGDQLYMDGQLHSSTHADVLLTRLAPPPREVLVVMPTNRHTAPGIGALAEQAAREEIAALEAAGCSVLWITPSAEDALRLGTNLMDESRTRDAYAVGVEAGQALVSKLC